MIVMIIGPFISDHFRSTGQLQLGPAEQHFQLCGNLIEIDKSSNQAGRSEEGRQSGQ